MKVCEQSTSLEILELDERLTRYWLSCPLPPEKRIQMEEHLKRILDRRFAACKVIRTNA
jgi:hypothetical protein